MLAGTRFRTFALVALPCVVFIYVLLRNAENGTSGMIESFHHYTHKLVDLGPIKTVTDYTQELSEALPWKSQGHPKVESLPHVESTPAILLEDITISTSSAGSSAGSSADSSESSSITLPAHEQSADISESTVVDLPHLQHLCRETNWTQGLWITCHSSCGQSQNSWCGGLNNARNRFQTCLRLAIDAGAGLILPEISPRGVGADVTVFGQDSCASDWFDLAHANVVMHANCPQLGLRAICVDAADGASIGLESPPETDAEAVGTPYRHYSEQPFGKGEFREAVLLPALQSAERINEFSGELVDGTTILEYGDTFLGWNYSKADELTTIRKELYKAIQFRENMRQIGETIRNSPQLEYGSFIAVHLRGEIDWPLEWGSADYQMDMYREEMANIRATDEGRNVSVVFVSSGEQEVIQVFREMLQPLNYTVHDKWTVLADMPDELDIVEEADFDSKGIVDHTVLVGAMYFMGLWMSTFSQHVAFARTIDDDEDFLNSVIFHDAVQQPNLKYKFEEFLSMQGNNCTKLIVIDYAGPTTESP